jgi:hypothetical protein
MPLEKELSCINVGIDSAFVVIGSSTGNIYILRSWYTDIDLIYKYFFKYYKIFVVYCI